MQDVGGLHDVHGFAFRYALFDVDEDYFVGNLSGYQYVSCGCAYIAGAYYCNF